MSKIFFGPSGNSESFYADGNNATVQAPAWLKARRLNAFEYSFGRGINIRSAAARVIGEEMRRYGIELSVHAPYYINFASPNTENVENSVGYIMRSLRLLHAFRGFSEDSEPDADKAVDILTQADSKPSTIESSYPQAAPESNATDLAVPTAGRVIFHAGSDGKAPRKESFARTLDGLRKLIEIKNSSPYARHIICPESMGKTAQIGTVAEVVEMCKLDPLMYPCFDFGHINALTRGALKTKDDFKRVIDAAAAGLDDVKVKNMHIHFSKIQYGDKGEIRHLTFADTLYGPEFLPLAEVIREYGLTPVIISESDGTQAEDAAEMLRLYNSLTR
ncbi:MAG: TIM barrel protein [Clostridiales bacterium]|jgi:deoxyribonuclease-4|nr:TIM barrel protein [Clostridiales bacterium]